MGDHLPPKKTVEILAAAPRDHAVRDVEVEKTVVIKIPSVARPRPTSNADACGAGSILKALSRIQKQRIAHGMFPVQPPDIRQRVLLKNFLRGNAFAGRSPH